MTVERLQRPCEIPPQERASRTRPPRHGPLSEREPLNLIAHKRFLSNLLMLVALGLWSLRKIRSDLQPAGKNPRAIVAGHVRRTRRPRYNAFSSSRVWVIGRVWPTSPRAQWFAHINQPPRGDKVALDDKSTGSLCAPGGAAQKFPGPSGRMARTSHGRN